MTLTPDIRDRLQKLVRLLSSDKEGEVLAAVSAMDRILEAAGLDFHTFADFLTDPEFDQARVKFIAGEDIEGIVRLRDGLIVQDPGSGPVDPKTGRKKPRTHAKAILRGDPWKNWCAQQRYNNRVLQEAQRRALPAPTDKPLQITKGVKA